jgi:hypothetical protein
MPYKPEQMRAIAAQMRRDGKSPEEISAFFRKHGHGGKGDKKKKLRDRMK